MFKFLILFVMFTISLGANSTTFRKLSLDQLIDESSSAVEVQLESKKTIMNALGMIMTEHSFRVLESYNLEKSELDNDILKLTLTGGTMNGVTSYIDGAPEFFAGERNFLLLKKIENRLYLSNFTLGKYKVIEEEGKTYYISTVFPSDPDMGKVAKKKMLEVIREKFKISYAKGAKKQVASVKNPVREASEKTRLPAQIDNELKKESFPYSLLFTTLSTFVICAFIAYRVFKKDDR